MEVVCRAWVFEDVDRRRELGEELLVTVDVDAEVKFHREMLLGSLVQFRRVYRHDQYDLVN